MSLFRKPGDSSSSEDDTSNTREEASLGAVDDPLSRVDSLESTFPAPRPLPPGVSTPSNRSGTSRANTVDEVRDLLLHSLLEEKALTEAAEHLGRSKTDPDVVSLAQQTYQGLAHQFAPQIDASYAREEMRGQRAAAKDGINRATRMQMTAITTAATATGTAAAAGVSQALVTRPSFLGVPANTTGTLSRGIKTLDQFYRQLPSSVQGHTGIHSNRYAHEYEEIALVGKGGYGKVYKVRNKLDNALYAVKRVVISSSKLQKIRERGDEELSSILDEVRSLAQFDHNNVVRYYGAWMEFTADTADVSDIASGRVTRSDVRLLEDASKASLTTSASDPLYDSFGNFDPFERGMLESTGIEFGEDSDIGAGAEQSGSIKLGEDSDIGAGAEQSGSIKLGKESAIGTGAEQSTGDGTLEMKPKGRARRASQATIVTISSRESRPSAVDEEEIETISRNHEPTYEESESIITDSGAPTQIISRRTPGPVLTLNIQMTLYEVDLADLLSDEKKGPTHCFHSCISLELLGEIIKGVEYLHESGVVHRDLKPANIFMSFSTKTVPPAGSIDMASCSACPGRSHLHITPRIGDFGLVAALGEAPTNPVGTEFYRPAFVGKIDEKLDVFALGVVGFELLERFGTRSERAEVLTKLRNGSIGDSFAANCGEMKEMVKRMVGGMVAANSDERWSCEEVRREIAKMVSGLKA